MKETCYPSILLMEHAAQAVVNAISSKSNHALFICGFGQNGGDGYAAARLYRGPCEVWSFQRSKLTGDALTNARLLSDMRPDVHIIDIDDEPPAISHETDIIVDALFGTGLYKNIDGTAARLIERVNESKLPVIACDIPSGIHSTTGEIMGIAVRAQKTITFHRPKIGLYLGNAVDFTGEITVADIGIPARFDPPDAVQIFEPADLPALRSARLKHSHKNTYGHVLIIAGSEGMAGAAALCAKASIKTGAGLVTVACDAAILPIIQTLVPGAMCVKLPTEPKEAAFLLSAACQKADTVAIGPGWTTRVERLPLLAAVIASGKPAVWDADALNLLAAYPSMKPHGDMHIYTPHPGEASRLLACKASCLQNDAASLQKMLGGVIVLKSATTIIRGSDHTAFNTVGTPALAKGGSGDVLTGILAALLAHHPNDPFFAARLGCLLHGMSGIRAASTIGEHALDIASLADYLP